MICPAVAFSLGTLGIPLLSFILQSSWQPGLAKIMEAFQFPEVHLWIGWWMRRSLLVCSRSIKFCSQYWVLTLELTVSTWIFLRQVYETIRFFSVITECHTTYAGIFFWEILKCFQILTYLYSGRIYTLMLVKISKLESFRLYHVKGFQTSFWIISSLYFIK